MLKSRFFIGRAFAENCVWLQPSMDDNNLNTHLKYLYFALWYQQRC